MQKPTFSWPQAIGIIVIVGLLFAGAYTVIQIGPFFPRTFSRLAAAVGSLTQTFIPGERLSATLTPAEIESGNETTLSWTHRNKTPGGIYTLTYPCIGDSRLGVYVSSGVKELLCDTVSEVVSTDSNLTLVALSGNSTVEIPLTLSYGTGGTTTSLVSNTTLIVTNDVPTSAEGTKSPGEPVPTTTPNIIKPNIPTTENVLAPIQPTAGARTEKTYPLAPIETPTPSIQTPYGKPDLAPRVIAVGTIDKITNTFTATTTLHTSDRIAVKFEVENIGTADSGSWYFSAVLPTYPMHIFQSEGQQNLGPGDRIEYTLGFDQVEPDADKQFLINVDPSQSLSEASELNNIATTSIRASLH